MILLCILVGIMVVLLLWVLWQWWRDEQEKLGKTVDKYVAANSGIVIPPYAPSTAPLHPSVDPYLADLRVYLLQDPLPTGPGDMANQVYAHLNQWMSSHAEPNAVYDPFEYGEQHSTEAVPSAIYDEDYSDYL